MKFERLFYIFGAWVAHWTLFYGILKLNENFSNFRRVGDIFDIFGEFHRFWQLIAFDEDLFLVLCNWWLCGDAKTP